MYYPVGWPKVLRLPPYSGSGEREPPAAAAAEHDGVSPLDTSVEVRQVVCNRDKILAAILTADALQIWYIKPCVPIISHRRPAESLTEIGENVLVQWRPDSSMICVVTSAGHLIIYHIVVPTDVKTVYEQLDPPAKHLRRESDELFMKELIPPLIFSLAFEVEIEGGISDLVAIREELMIATRSGHILRFAWDGQEIRDYSLDLKRIPFCMDQQVLKAVPLADRGAFVSKIAYSPLLGGYAITLNDGRAAFLVAGNASFDPNSVTGIWAPQLDDATCIALNHKYKLMAFGRKNSQGVVYSIDDLTGGLALMHRLVLRTRDFPGFPGEVTCLRWTPDGTALAMTWSLGGFSIWSTFGAMVACSLCWDYGPRVSDPVSQNPLCLLSIDWSAEGYQLWMVNAKHRQEREEDPEFMPFPKEYGDDRGGDKAKSAKPNPLANKVLVLQFVKSPLAVNPGMSKQEHVYLQGEDRLYLNLGQTREFSDGGFGGGEPMTIPGVSNNPSTAPPGRGNISLSLMSSGSKQWTAINIPHTYMGNSWPIRFTALDEDCQYLAVAGRTGLAHYSIAQRRWRLFGNETQEKDFIVTGGLLWWRGVVLVGCYNLAALQDEVRAYPRGEKLDNAFAKIFKVDAQVLLLNLLNDQLIVFCADNQIDIFNLAIDPSLSYTSVTFTKTRTYDANRIPGLSFHPACVILVALTQLRTETSRSTGRDSLSRESPTGSGSSPAKQLVNSSGQQQQQVEPSIIFNICGRVIMIQPEPKNVPAGGGKGGRESPQMTLPTVLASCCETIWFPRRTNPDKPHLTASLWLYCGAHGMRVWLPVFPREGDQGHTFMSKRIMLHFPLEKLYPLAILFEDAIILGAENDTMLMTATGMSSTNVPYSTLERTSLLFLHPILRQLIRRNLGYHAWEIARTCMMLPYFQHSLELLLHEVLEEEATSTEPIPDALLPSVVEFIQEFPVFHRTIGRCARKTEVALWPHLFAVVGSPGHLFTECLSMKDLETAASYLLILQNLEAPAVAQNHATLLLDAALDNCSWELAKELVRFLRTIDPDELEEAAHHRSLVNMSSAIKSKQPQTPPILNNLSAAAPEEEISLLLGTLQVPRGRSTSVTQGVKLASPRSGDHKELIRSSSEANKTSPSGAKGVNTADALARSRKASSSSLREPSSAAGQTADEFFIDIILQRHARKLLSQVRLHDLGTFAAQLDFHMVAWLKKEAARAARLDDVVTALKKVHRDFQWPFPILLNSVVNDLKRKQSQSESTSGASSGGGGRQQQQMQPFRSNHNSFNAIDEKFRALKVDVGGSGGGRGHHLSGPAAVSDSGYLSHHNATNTNVASSTKDDFSTDQNILSEQTINAMLRPHTFREDMSMISDDVASLTTPEDSHSNHPMSDWSSLQAAQAADYASAAAAANSAHEAASRGPQKSEIQLRYLLQILLEANCLELSAVISIVLKDALALIRIVNAARTSAHDSKLTVMRLFKGLKALEHWAQADCPGYCPFFQAIQPQLNSLKSFLNLQSPSSLSASSSLPPRPPSAQASAGMSRQGAGGSRKNSPMTAGKPKQGAAPGTATVHRSSSVSEKPKLAIKQLSLPSDMVPSATAVRSNTVAATKAASPAAAQAVTASTRGKNISGGGGGDEDDDQEDTRSVTSDILPEGQDEQAGCVLS